MKKSLTEIIYFLAAIFLFINLILAIRNASGNFFRDIGISPVPYLIAGAFTFFALVVLKKKFQFQFLKKFNTWFILSIILIAVLLVFTFELYNKYTSYQLPISFTLPIGMINNNSDILASVKTPLYVTYESSGNERDFVLNTVVYSLMNLTYNENFTYHLSEIKKTYFYKNNTEVIEMGSMDRSQINAEYSFTQYWNLDFKIDNNFDHALVELYFSNDSKNPILTNRYWVNPRAILSEDVYLSKTKDSISLFLTAISILLFSTVAVIKNLMDIYHCKQK